jgi:phosphoribosyl 1,2-cyclic phosphate phosphodiesterase
VLTVPIADSAMDQRLNPWQLPQHRMSGSCEITFLGTGTSVGVPVIGCDCAVCQSKDPRNKRTRSSIHVVAGEISLLVDSGPDLREQALRESLRRLDGVLYTHAHVDHVAGFDELRAFCWHRDSPLPLHGSPQTLEVLRQMYGWAFHPDNTHAGYIKPLAAPWEGEIRYDALRVTPLPVEHGNVETHGFLFEYPGAESLAYISDAKSVPAATIDLVRGVDHLVIDALRPRAHPTHLSTPEALEVIAMAGAKMGWLTHLGHENEHGSLEAELPANVRVAYDGLRISLKS